jgi:hypothetical protein
VLDGQEFDDPEVEDPDDDDDEPEDEVLDPSSTHLYKFKSKTCPS